MDDSPKDDDELSEFLSSVTSDDSKIKQRPSSPLWDFVVANWVSCVLLAQAVVILGLFGLLLATQSREVFFLYAFCLLIRWGNYLLALYAVFHDRSKWFAVLAAVVYTLCSLSGSLLISR